MTKTTINKIKDFNNKEILISGWVYNKRTGGSIVFLQVRDGTGFVQATVLKNEVSTKVFNSARDITFESSLEIKGKVREDKRAQGGFELTVSDITVISKAKDEYPIGKKEHGPDFLLSKRHLWLRSKRQWAIQRIRNTIIYAIYNSLNSQGFIKIDSPIFTPSACEGTTTLFPVPYLPAWPGDRVMEDFINKKFDNDNSKYPFVYLSQSGQLYLEAAIFSLRRVFDFGPTFRAEKSKTRRHLNEFWMMDAEAAFVDWRENMAIQEKLIKDIVSVVLSKNSEELKLLERDITGLETTLKGNFEIISHKDAVAVLNKKGIKIGVRDDFGAEAETELSKEFDRPFFIEKYPKEVKAFYMKEDPSDNSRVLNSDLLAHEGYGEISGGSQREDDYDKLLSKIKKHNLPLEDFQWYLDLRVFGSVKHSGFGIGLERIIAWVCKLEHVRESIPFPRMIDRFKP